LAPLLDALLTETTPSAGMRGAEERDLILGRLFGLAAVARLQAPPGTAAGASGAGAPGTGIGADGAAGVGSAGGFGGGAAGIVGPLGVDAPP
jgi:hypothetical protein